MGYYITLSDLFIVPIYLLIIFFLAFKIRNKYYPIGHKLHKYFIPGLIVKVFGSLAICFIYVCYFKGGDSIFYFDISKIINSSITDDFPTWIRLITHTANPDIVSDGYYLSQIGEQSYHINNYTVSVTASLFGLICFEHYLCIALLMGTIAYSGLWALFIVFTKLYPRLIKESAIAALFIPAVAIWGSGVFKDTICMFALGWVVFLFFKINRFRRFKFLTIVIFCLFCYLIFIVKVYIIAALFPILLLRLCFKITFKHKNVFHKVVFLSVVLLATLRFSGTIARAFTNNLAEILLDNFTQTVSNFSNNSLQASIDANGSGYSLGELDGSARDLITKIPAAINVTFYRPYLWEAGKSITLLASLESLALLIFSCYVVFKVRLRIFKYIFTDVNLFTFLFFSLILGYAIGLTTSNFGTLSRFKIPCLPFFLMSLFIIQHSYQKDKSRLINME